MNGTKTRLVRTGAHIGCEGPYEHMELPQLYFITTKRRISL
jgi:hypothetical protein